jgi:hypothetical protein
MYKIKPCSCFTPFVLDTFALNLVNNLHHFLTELPHFRFNQLNAGLIQICHLLALLGAQHIFRVSGLRVKDIWLSVRADVAGRVRISRCQTKQSVCALTAQFVIYRALAIRFRPCGVFALILVLPTNPTMTSQIWNKN